MLKAKLAGILLGIIGGFASLAMVFLTLSMTGALPAMKNQITIVSETYTKIYDGKSADIDDYKITSGTLYDGDTLEVTFTLVGSDVDVYTNYFDCKVKNASGQDVTKSYNITKEYGTLTITERTLTLAVKNETEPYNGKVLKPKEYTLTGELAPGDEISVTYDGEIEEVGKVTSRVYASIKNQEGRSVTSNYKISSSTGTLVKTQIPLKITSKSMSKPYDGYVLLDDSTTPESMEGTLLDGDTLIYTPINSLLEAGEVDNDFTYEIKDKDDNDVTHHYQIEKDLGTLEITKKQIRLVSKDHMNIPYTGEEFDLSSETMAYTSDEVADTDVLHPIFTTSVKNAGVVDNRFIATIVNQTTNVDVTKNYDITAEYGLIQILKKDLTINTLSGCKVYGDSSWLDQEMNVISDIKKVTGTDDLITGHSYQVEFSPLLTNAGSQDNFCIIKIYDKNHNNVTKNYNITYNYGTLMVSKRQITLKASSASKKADGTPLTSSEWYLVSGNTAPNEYLSVHTEGSQTTVGESLNIIKYSIMDSNGVMLSNYPDNYTVTTENGCLWVYSADQTSVYIAPKDGYISKSEYLSKSEYDYGALPYEPLGIVGFDTYLAKGFTVEYEFTDDSKLSTVGTVITEISSIKIKNGTTDVTNEFDIHLMKGVLQIFEEEIQIATGSTTVTYDGTLQTYEDVKSGEKIGSNGEIKVTLGTDTLTIKYSMLGAIKNVGEALNTINIIGIYKNDETENIKEHYKLTITTGKIKVTQATLTVVTPSASASSHDVSSVSNTEIPASNVTGLATGDSIYVTKGCQQVGKGICDNKLEVGVKDSLGNDVTTNYIITYIYGKLELTD